MSPALAIDLGNISIRRADVSAIGKGLLPLANIAMVRQTQLCSAFRTRRILRLEDAM
jgi:hypothetical protein